MARTALVDLLRRAAAISAVARHSGEPLDELVARDIELRRTSSRRRFLRQAATATTALALTACTPAPLLRGNGADEVVIVGAGVAGLTCAWRLRQAGIGARVYEAQDRIGGRMFSLRNHFADGQVCELGGELIDTGHTRIRALAAEFDLPLDDLSEDPTHAFGDVWYCEGRRYSEEEILLAFAPLADAIRRESDALPEEEITYASPGGCEALDKETISAWLDRNGASGWLRRLIEVAYTTEMGLDCDQQSALNLLTFIDPGTEAFHIFGESDERFHVRGGNDLITSNLGSRLGSAIETGCVLEAVRQSADGRYSLQFKRGASAFEVRARRIVLAMPFTTLRRVQLDLELPAIKRRAINELGYGTNAKLMIGFNERVWRTRDASSGSSFSDLPVQSTWETSRMQPGAAGILTNFVGGKHGLEVAERSARQQADLAAQQLDAIYPGLSSARAGAKEARMNWPSQPWVLGSYACYRPGQWTGIRGAAGQSVGNLHFIGEHCAFDNQGFMEGGVETGEWAAQALATESLARTG
jgi:monoamine oxidase